MCYQRNGHLGQCLRQTVFKMPSSKCSPHVLHHGLPLVRVDMAVQAAVCDQFDLVFTQQQIDQHPVVVFNTRLCTPPPHAMTRWVSASSRQRWRSSTDSLLQNPAAVMLPTSGRTATPEIAATARTETAAAS